MDPLLQKAVGIALDAEVIGCKSVSGGDINQAFELLLEDKRRVFVKTHVDAPAAMFETEAEGLRWLADANTLRVPAVLAQSDPFAEQHFLALEWVDPKPPAANHDAMLGQGLAALHRAGAPGFGLARNNFVGRLPQDNRSLESWSEFYVLRRLEPMLKTAVDTHRASSFLKSGLNKLFTKMDDRVGDPEPPARLHGDLWSGNAIQDDKGLPVLIDPAVYGGHREVDLAMMRLFGGFSDTVFQEYNNAYPLLDGWRDRVPLYQLYPLMVHVNLFGGHYGDQAEHALRKVI